MMKSPWFVVIALIVGVALAACSSAPAPTPVPPTAVPPATVAPTAVPPTAVPPTTAPTSTSTQPSSSSSSQPVPTLAATAAPTATAVPPTATAPKRTATAQAATQPKATAVPSGGGAAQIDLNVLIPQGDGRDLVMDNCMSCHSIAPVLVSQKTAGEWEGTKNNHRAALAHINDAEVNKLFAYLAKYFGPDHKVPDLPPELLAGWTNY